jgi:hypothetical protein
LGIEDRRKDFLTAKSPRTPREEKRSTGIPARVFSSTHIGPITLKRKMGSVREA